MTPIGSASIGDPRREVWIRFDRDPPPPMATGPRSMRLRSHEESAATIWDSVPT
jgi:hypothetical protein